MQAGHTPTPEDKMKDVSLPTNEDMSYQLQKLVEQGVLTPEEAQAAVAGRSEMDNVTTDPSLKAAQMDALSGLQGLSKTGLTDSDKSALNQIRTDEDTRERGARDAIIQGAQQRGMGGSGLDLMAQLQNEQNSASRRSQSDMDIAGKAQDRALQALIQAGNTAGNMRGEDFSEGAAKAGANDAISKFNAQNQQQTNLANAGTANQVNAMNLNNKQNVANTNAAIQTQQNAQKAAVAQQQFQNQMQHATGQQNAANTVAQIQGQNSKDMADANNKNASMVFSSMAALSDERAKEKIEEFSPSDFLDSLTGYKYEYKDKKKHGAGKKIGVMAQDLEKSDVGSQMVHESPEGKVVDYGKAAPAMMAALADLHKRVKGMEGKGA